MHSKPDGLDHEPCLRPPSTLGKYLYYLISAVRILAGLKSPYRVLPAFVYPTRPYGMTVELRRSGLKFRVRNAMDIWAIKETFLDRFYERYGVAVGAGWTIVDIGAGIGDYTIFAAARHPDTVVYAFEPTPDSFELLQENVAANHIGSVQAFQQAVWNTTGQLLLNISSGDANRHTTLPESRSLSDSLVECVSLDEVFSRLEISHCNVLKMDCEGAEFPILLGAAASTLEKIGCIVMEFHDGITDYDHRDLAAYLNTHGFAVNLYPNRVHAQIGFLRATR